MRTHRRRIPTEAGFTLIEVVLALTIFALMGTILYAAFSLGHSAVEKSQSSFERNQRLRSFADLLGSYIRSSYPYRLSPQDTSVYFLGEEDSLTFVSAFSVAMGGRGMAKIHIWLDAEDQKEKGGILRLEEEVPVRIGDESGAVGIRNSVGLQEGVSDLRVTYLEPQGDADNWVERWDAKERRTLPRAVRLSYRTAAGKEVRWDFPVMMSVLAQ
jgi:prepilin-type N-terminal cleavage/methylation domain-containing protein